MKHLKKALIGATTVTTAATVIVPLASYTNGVEAEAEVDKTTSTKSSTPTKTTNSEHNIQPIDGVSWFGAELWYGGFKNHYATAKEAFEFMNSDFIKSYDNVTFVLFEDWVADNDGKFTDKYGSIRIEDRNNKKDKVTIELNGFKLDGNRRGKSSVDHGVLELRKNGTFIVKNGTITGGKCEGNGAGVFFDNDETTATLQNIKITDNITIGNKKDHNNGAGLYVKKCDGKLILDDVTITNNRASGYGGGVYIQASDYRHHLVTLKNTITIKDNFGDSARNNFIFQSHCDQMHVLEDKDIYELASNSEIWFDVSDQKCSPIIECNKGKQSEVEEKIKSIANCWHLDSNIHGRKVNWWNEYGDAHDDSWTCTCIGIQK